jgi:hypothetical protein
LLTSVPYSLSVDEAAPLHRQPVREQIDLHLRDAVAKDGVFGDTVRAGHVRERLALVRAGIAHRRDERPLVLEHRLGHVPPAVGLADEVACGHAHAFEERLAERGRPADEANGPDADAGRAHVDEEETDALVLRRLEIGAHEAEHPVGEVRVRRPDLASIDHVRVAVEHRARPKAGEVRPGIRLAVALAPADLATRDPRQVLALLLLVPVLEEHGAQHPQPHALEGSPAPEAGHLFAQDRRLIVAQAAAAVLARPRGRGPSTLGHAFEPCARIRIGRRGLLASPDPVVAVGRRRAHGRRAALLEPHPDIVPKHIEHGHGRI